MTDLKTVVTTKRLEPTAIHERTRAIYEQLLRESRYIKRGNFDAFHPRDLELLYRAYDEHFFDGSFSQTLATIPLTFRLSRRLTSSAGTTTRRRRRDAARQIHVEYEICISSTLMFQTFRDVDRVVTTSGIECRDRVEALQRVFEHELIHLAEMLVWDNSQCAAPRFQQITRSLFGHREHTHQLITQRERALAKFGLKVGDRVAFQIEQQPMTGVINRITRRATVLVEDPRGQRYSDGKRYSKYYVPLDLLRPASPRPSRAV